MKGRFRARVCNEEKAFIKKVKDKKGEATG